MKRPKIIKATEVEKDAIYMVGKRPCKVVCSNEQGWKRGFVILNTDEFNRFYAVVKFLDDGSNEKVLLKVTNDGFLFESVGYPTLLWLTPELLGKLIEEYQIEIDRLNRKVASLSTSHEILKSLSL